MMRPGNSLPFNNTFIILLKCTQLLDGKKTDVVSLPQKPFHDRVLTDSQLYIASNALKNV